LPIDGPTPTIDSVQATKRSTWGCAAHLLDGLGSRDNCVLQGQPSVAALVAAAAEVGLVVAAEHGCGLLLAHLAHGNPGEGETRGNRERAQQRGSKGCINATTGTLTLRGIPIAPHIINKHIEVGGGAQRARTTNLPWFSPFERPHQPAVLGRQRSCVGCLVAAVAEESVVAGAEDSCARARAGCAGVHILCRVCVCVC